ncbi:cation diffusion facilitator family transporter [Halosimplex amylolyticum]|uniref:cation diffusion facilitator family transporter n=1 Tax=Halosimplex amylolyticum TaxID=3396616 RepID=UPI003F554920
MEVSNRSTGAALVGVRGMAVGFPIFDPIAGVVVSLLVVHQGVDISRENRQYLADSAPPESEQAEIKQRIRDHSAVHRIHDFAAYYSGHVIEVESHAEVEQAMTVVEARDLESELRQRVREIDRASDVHAHLDPAGLGEWKDTAESASSSA